VPKIAKTKKRDKAKELFWRLAIGRQLECGLTQSAFCEKESLNPNAFSWWKREIARRENEQFEKNKPSKGQPAFVSIAQKVKTDSAKPIAEIDLSTGLVRILSGVDRRALQEIIAALREVGNS
jgi:transposase